MSKRLQVLIKESEYKKFAKQAGSEGKSLGEWVRQSLRSSMRISVGRSPEEKMDRLLALARKCAFPIADIDQLLKEIEQGYLSGDIR